MNDTMTLSPPANANTVPRCSLTGFRDPFRGVSGAASAADTLASYFPQRTRWRPPGTRRQVPGPHRRDVVRPRLRVRNLLSPALVHATHRIECAHLRPHASRWLPLRERTGVRMECRRRSHPTVRCVARRAACRSTFRPARRNPNPPRGPWAAPRRRPPPRLPSNCISFATTSVVYLSWPS